MLFLPLWEKAVSKQLEQVIPHFIVCQQKTFRAYSSIQPVPAADKKKRHKSTLGNKMRISTAQIFRDYNVGGIKLHTTIYSP